MEYFLLNIPKSLSANPLLIIRALLENGNADYFETLPVQILIKYKWETFTKSFFERQFYLFLIFFGVLFADIYYSIINKLLGDDNEVIEDDRHLYVFIPFKLVCSAILGYFTYYEIK